MLEDLILDTVLQKHSICVESNEVRSCHEYVCHHPPQVSIPEQGLWIISTPCTEFELACGEPPTPSTRCDFDTWSIEVIDNGLIIELEE